jgi:anti-sigma B factor antagonist
MGRGAVTVRVVGTAEGVRGRAALETDPAQDATVVVLSGEFDIETVPSIETCLRRSLGPFYFGRHLIVDLSQATFIDSSFISFLVTMASKVRKGDRELILVRPVGQVRSVLLLVGLPNLVPVYDSMQQASDSLRLEPLPLIPPSLPRQPAD